MRIFTFLLLSILLAPVVAGAQGHNIYCDMADSTAATQNCLKRHLDASQKRLNKTYDALNRHFENEEKKQELKSLQQKWIEYRDAECSWEVAQTETPSLERINELSCLARLTDDRADILSVVTMDEETMGMVREYGSFPRWMNVLAKDHPTVYWDYGRRFARDLNCDEETEQIMTGTILKKKGDDLSQEMVIAVTENPSIGRPRANVFRFSVVSEEKEEGLCSATIGLNVMNKQDKKGLCLSKLSVKHGTCAEKIIQWDGKTFAVKKQENKEEKDKK